MDISRKTLIVTFIINLLLIAIAAACMIITKFAPAVLWLSIATMLLVLTSSVIIWLYAREMRKQ
jgi:hypothetical protein